MRSLRFALTGLALLIGLATWPGAGSGRAQGPGKPQWLQHFYGSQPPNPLGPVVRGSQPEAEPNQDILVRPEHGPWMVSIISYTGAEAPKMAREMVNELRGPTYNLPAYVFNYASERRRQERQRVEDMIKVQKERYQQLGAAGAVTIRVPKIQIEDQCAVLVGGYNDMDTARRALDAIKRLRPPDPTRVKLDTAMKIREGDHAGDRGEMEVSPSNPFKHSFVVHNPSAPNPVDPDRNKLDVGVLRKLNRGEDYSLLNCPKAFTLAIAGYSVPTVLVQQHAPSSFWDKFGLGKGDREDAAAHSAHNLAEQIRKGWKVDAYVLHTNYSSIVTVGAYDSPNDPRMKSMQEWVGRLSALPQLSAVQFFPEPRPTQVPR